MDLVRGRLLVALTLCLCLVPMVSADPEQDPVPPPNQTSQQCRVVYSNTPYGPVSNWVIVDPDGCYRRMLDRVLPAEVQNLRIWPL